MAKIITRRIESLGYGASATLAAEPSYWQEQGLGCESTSAVDNILRAATIYV